MPRQTRTLTLSHKELLVLQLLAREEEMYGLQLVVASKGNLKRGTVYVTLGRMEDKGYVTFRTEPAPADVGGMPRRIYRPTALGLRMLRAWTAIPRRLVPQEAS